MVTTALKGNVGIGTTSPSSKLEVAAGATANVDIAHFSNSNGIVKIKHSLAVDGSGEISVLDGYNTEDIRLSAQGNSWFNAGNVGIGTTSPSELLDVSSNTGAAGGTANPTTIRISDTSYGSAWDTVNSFANLDFHSADTSGSGAGVKARVGAIAENTTGASIGLAFSTTYSTYGLLEKMRIDNNGNVGIGTASPNEKLDVVGNIKASGTVRTGSMTVSVATGSSSATAVAAGEGAMTYISNESGGATIAFSDGIVWRRVSDRAPIS